MTAVKTTGTITGKDTFINMFFHEGFKDEDAACYAIEAPFLIATGSTIWQKTIAWGCWAETASKLRNCY